MSAISFKYGMQHAHVAWRNSANTKTGNTQSDKTKSQLKNPCTAFLCKRLAFFGFFFKVFKVGLHFSSGNTLLEQSNFCLMAHLVAPNCHQSRTLIYFIQTLGLI